MKPLHPLLQHQLTASSISSEQTESLLPLLQDISSTYYTHEEAKEQLSESLDKINKEMDRFVYSVSHDLRAPMASLLGLLNIAELEENPEAVRQYQGLMRNSVIRMERFITNLLNYSSSNRQENIPELVDFKETAEEIASSLRHLPHAFTIDFIQEYELPFPFYTDIHKLRIILTNLLSNAIQYHNIDQPHPFIRLTVRSTSEEVCIEVEDNGQGIEQEYHQKIFDMFFRGNMGSSGNGLGLYIVKEMISKLGGSIGFTSKAGKGTHFSITLPSLKAKSPVRPVTVNAN